MGIFCDSFCAGDAAYAMLDAGRSLGTDMQRSGGRRQGKRAKVKMMKVNGYVTGVGQMHVGG